ncbi:benzoate/H(+) symporter BenE family transporter, partial [Micromonospora foliorum]|uniref:benzoate/H(+) symporter BenE family transporter n=1 Tax=Micromonospora foliorum TaxID=2911210 RepID=UPI001EE9586D
MDSEIPRSSRRARTRRPTTAGSTSRPGRGAGGGCGTRLSCYTLPFRKRNSREGGVAGRVQPVLAGVVTALVGFASSFTVVLAGLRAAGASDAQAASGLLALCVASGLVAAWLGLRYRMPMSAAWSTPGAALLVATGPPPGGWPVAVGAFLVSGALIVAAGLFPPLGR